MLLSTGEVDTSYGRSVFALSHDLLGGYLSPSHDSYVSTKHDGSAGLLDAHRLRLCHEAVAMSEWLMVAPWEARYVPCALNYTDVLLRLERYLNHHLRLPAPLRVGYVFGGDNAAFARTFLSQGYAVCIERPGYESAVASIQQEVSRANARIAFARPRLEYFNISSSRIRSEEMDAMPERSSRYYSSLKLCTRIRMPASQEVAFSVAMWQANERFFVGLERQCDPASRNLMHYLGFVDSRPVLDVVRWHRLKLEESTRR